VPEPEVEDVVLHDLRVYAQPHRGEVRFYRDNKGLEVDAIVEAPDGRWFAAEIRLGHNCGWRKARATCLPSEEALACCKRGLWGLARGRRRQSDLHASGAMGDRHFGGVAGV
jgi:hypothetical protein